MLSVNHMQNKNMARMYIIACAIMQLAQIINAARVVYKVAAKKGRQTKVSRKANSISTPL